MRGRRVIVAITAAVLLSCAAAAPALATSTTTASTTQVAAQFSNTSITAQDGIAIPVTITAGETALSNATLSLDLRHIVLQDVTLVSNWLNGSTSQATWGGDRHVSTYTIPAVAENSSTTMTISATRAQLALSDLSQAQGFIPFSVTAQFADGSTEVVRGIVPWNLTNAVGATRIVVPVTAPATEEELYSEKELTQWVATGGTLDSILQAVGTLPVILAIDPKIIASISALNANSLPAQWLSQLTSGRTAVPLAYGNADVASLAAAGLTSLPTLDPSASTLTATTTAWQQGTSLTTDAINLYSGAGYTSITIPSSRIKNLSWGQLYSINGMNVLVTDTELTEAITTAISSGGSAIQIALATRALVDDPNVDRLVVLPTDWSTTAGHLEDLVDAYTSTSWTSIQTSDPTTAAQSSTSTASASGSATTTAQAELTGSATLPLDANVLTTLVSQTLKAWMIAGLVQGTDGTNLTNKLSRTLLSLSASQWSGSSDWSTAVDTATDSATTVANGVYLAPQAAVRLVSNESVLPVPVVNDLPYPVQVNVSVRPSNGKLVVTMASPVTIDAKSTTQVLVPVRAVANGDVTLTLQLTNSAGTLIGDLQDRDMTVNAEWESLTAIGLASVIFLFFGFGLFVSIRRRIRARRAGEGEGAGEGGQAEEFRADGTGHVSEQDSEQRAEQTGENTTPGSFDKAPKPPTADGNE